MKIEEIKNKIDEIDKSDLNLFAKTIKEKDKIIILGNGGSNAISSHISQDYTKFLKKKCICFSDASRLTCYINDFGMSNAYAKFIEDFGDNNTLVILISSSGNSENILNAAKYCVENDIEIITLSGFSNNNKLRHNYSKNSIVHFWVNSNDYGVVEITHELILHSII